MPKRSSASAPVATTLGFDEEELEALRKACDLRRVFEGKPAGVKHV